MPVVSSFAELLSSFAPLMTTPTYQNFLVIAAGWLMSNGKRTVTGIIQRAGAVDKKHYSTFHRFFSFAAWDLNALSRALLGLLLKFVPEGDVVQLAMDDTLCRKRGLHIFGTCMHHDPLISCRRVSLVNWGHNWVVVGLVLRFPFAPGIVWCLPFAFRLYISRKRAKSQRWTYSGIEHKTRPELAAEILKMVGEWFPGRQFHVFGDSAYGGKSVLGELPANFNLTSRICMDARLYAPAPAKNRGRGRPRKRGKKLATPAQLANDSKVRWKKLRIEMYGKKKSVQVKEIQGLWPSAGDRQVKVTVVRDPAGKTRDQAFFTTELRSSSKDTLVGYSSRWSIEVAFQNTKSRFGFEDPQSWTRKAVERTAPMAMILYSLVIAWFAERGHKKCKFPKRPWYPRKSAPAFSDMLATVRRESLREYFLNTPQWDEGSGKIIARFADVLGLTG